MFAGIFTLRLTGIMLFQFFVKVERDFLRWRGINVETCKCGPASMRLGIWTPLPHTIRAEPVMEEGVRQVKTRGDGGPDKSFEFALDVVSKGEALGFDITLIAERLLGPDLEAWMLTAALAARTKTIQIMPAVYPGMITPQLAAKMGARSTASPAAASPSMWSTAGTRRNSSCSAMAAGSLPQRPATTA